MQPRPLYRWKSFWLGILILIFLGSAWAFSTGHFSDVMLGVPGHGLFALAQTNGEIALLHDANPAAVSWQFKASSGPALLEQAHHDAWRETYSSIGILPITHLQLILGFLIPWTAFLAWRWRRMRRT